MNKLVFFLTGFALFFAACKKDPSVIGLDVQPTGDRILNVRECLLPVSAYTMSEESITSDERSYNLLGSYIDPIFGPTSADFVTQIRLAANNVSFSNLTSVDSITLFLAYSSCYGDTLSAQTPQHIKVFELTNDIKLTDTIYSNFAVNNYFEQSIKLADFIFTPKLSDTVLAIKLDTALAGKILRTSLDSLATADIFMKRFKGLYIQADTSTFGRIIMYFNLLSTKTKLSVYYNSGQRYDLVINSSCARINMFHHNYSGLNLYLNDSSVTRDSSLVYIQSMSGPRVKIKLPSLSTWQDSGIIVINKAEFILKVDGASIADGKYAPPVKLFLVAANQSEKYSFLNDYLKNKKYFGGVYDATTTSYKFNIPLQIQDLISGSLSNNRLYLFPESNRTTGNRVVIQNSLSNPIQLKITYTKL